jgi:hypothetical protein
MTEAEVQTPGRRPRLLVRARAGYRSPTRVPRGGACATTFGPRCLGAPYGGRRASPVAPGSRTDPHVRAATSRPDVPEPEPYQPITYADHGAVEALGVADVEP